MKRIFSTIILLLFSAGTVLAMVEEIPAPSPSPSTASTFTDIQGHKYQEAIKYIKEAKIVQGYEDGTYKPDTEINRAEFTKIIIGATATPEQIGSDLECFPDIHAEWFAKFVCFAKSKNVIKGYPDGTFKPENKVNLAEALKITFEAFNYVLPDESDKPWYYKYVKKAESLEIISTINPDINHFLSRGEMAQIIFSVKNPSTPSNSGAVSLGKTFTSEKMNVTMRYPNDWQYNEEEEYFYTFQPKDGSAIVKIQKLATAKSGGNYINLQTMVADIKAQYKSQGGGITQEEYVDTGVEQVQAYTGIATFTTNGDTYKEWITIIPSTDGNILYMWSYMAATSNYDKYYATASSMLDTWLPIQKH